MTSQFILAAIDKDQLSGIFWVLFWAFLIAALIWWIIWALLLGADEDGSAQTTAEPKSDNAGKPAATKVEPEEPEAADESVPEIDTATEAEATSAFSDEISAGKAKFDDNYGIVYTSSPDDVDDLKEIKGIAKVLEGKLHDIGVYKFKQVAYWTDAACAEFAKMLTFKDRIYRDDWIAQAKDFHEKKYGEKL